MSYCRPGRLRPGGSRRARPRRRSCRRRPSRASSCPCPRSSSCPPLAGERWKAAEATPRSTRIGCGAAQRDGAAKRRAGIVERGAGAGVVDRDRAKGRELAVSGLVSRARAKLVVPVGECARVPGDGVGRARVGVDRSPGAATGGAALEEEGADTGAARIGAVGRDGHRCGDEAPVGRGSQGGTRSRVVDPAVGDRGRGGRVTGVVGDDHTQVIEPVRNGGRVESGRGGRPGAGAGGGVLIRAGGDTGAGVARGRAERHRPTQVGARIVQAGAGSGVVDPAVGDRGRDRRVTGVVGDVTRRS